MKQKRFAVATTTWLAIFTTVAPAVYGQTLPESGAAAAPGAPALSTVPFATDATPTTTRQTPAAKPPWRAKITASGPPGAINTSVVPSPSYQSYQTGAAPKMTWKCCARRTVCILDETPIIRDARAVPTASPGPRPQSASKKHK